MVRLKFRDFLDLERDDKLLGKSKLNWKRDLHGVIIPQKIIQCAECENDKTCKQCEISPKMKCFECEVTKTCKKCLNKIPQSKQISTEII